MPDKENFKQNWKKSSIITKFQTQLLLSLKLSTYTEVYDPKMIDIWNSILKQRVV